MATRIAMKGTPNMSHFEVHWTRGTRWMWVAGLAATFAFAGAGWGQPIVGSPAAAVAEPPEGEAIEAGGEVMMPGAEAAMMAQPGVAGVAGGSLPAEQKKVLRAQYDALSPDEQARMMAYYLDLGIDLDQEFGFAAARQAQLSKGQMIVNAMRGMNFQRTPSAVLGARSSLGFGQVPFPNPEKATPMDTARWIHLHTLAGEWAALGSYLKSRPLPEGEAIYSFVLQGLGRGDPGLLPEETLDVAEACPGELKPWMMETLGKVLGAAAGKNSTGAMLARVRAGTRLFGGTDEATRRRTVEFLAGGGLVKEAYEYLSPADKAMEDGDAELLLVHARHKLALAEGEGDAARSEGLRREAWDVLTGAALLSGARPEPRREALRRAIGMMHELPKSAYGPWLSRVFSDRVLGPVALELMALEAAGLGDSKKGVEERAQTILTLKEGVDALLERGEHDSATLRVPLRMLTTALVAEMERAVQGNEQNRGMNRGRPVAREAQLLLRAIPSERWLSGLEESLSMRARKASIAIALKADETEQALGLLRDAIGAAPGDAANVADHLLVHWEKQLNPPEQGNDDLDYQWYFYYREFLPMAPLTRGRQQRNLDRLAGLVRELQAAGVDTGRLPGLAPTFRACHARTEVYDRANIERVFGAMSSMPAATSVTLAQSMAAGLNGDWRSRQTQKATGAKRTDLEIAAMVDKGYGVALELMDSAMASDPSAWKIAGIRAGIAFDRMQFQLTQGKIADPAKQNEYRREAFEAFARAAERYAKAITAGTERDDPTIYRRWFGAAMGTAELNFLRPDDLPKEGTAQDDQIELIRGSIDSMPPEARDRHLATLAADVLGAVGGADPEVKPRLVKHALRIIKDHPAGAGLRAMQEVYLDLVKNELRLRLTIDGDDRVGVDKAFGVMVSLRYTNSVERETGGFGKYLQNGVFGRVGNSYREMNYRDELKKNLETTFSKGFVLESVGFFDPFMPARGVVEEGQDGWVEKPMAYLVVTRRDASTDRLPQVVMDMQFTDQTGPVTLALPSNTPLIAQGEASARRPVKKLSVSQLVDLRAISEGGKNEHPSLEVLLRGEGVLPAIEDVLAGVESALPGYEIDREKIERRPVIVLQEGSVSSGRYAWMSSSQEPKEGYPEPDEGGMYRLKAEQSVLIPFKRAGGGVGSRFTLPTLREGEQATMDARAYSELDIVPVTGASVPVARAFWTRMTIALSALAAAAAGMLVWWARRPRGAAMAMEASALAGAKLTPLGVVTSLRRLRASSDPAHNGELDREIAALELKYFGPDMRGTGVDVNELRGVIERWSRRAV
ncbi:MAG: hypothetical protein JNL50_06580 [Phycisphaerae bacterium]|nr:hypothetical protein [Phycisphaerae bacterium]